MSLSPRAALAGRAVVVRRASRAALGLCGPLFFMPILSFPPPVGAVSGTGPLRPAPVGQGMCQAQGFADGSVQGQIAVYQTSCAVATATLGPGADHAKGTPYSVAGYTCKATKEGAGSAWASAWGGTYYAYSCADGSAQAAFNWGRDYTYGSSGAGSTAGSGGGTSPFSATGHHLLPAPVGQGMCQAREFADGSVQAQIAVYQTTCAVATTSLGPAADHAQGTPYTVDGFTCKATKEGAGSAWVSSWGGTYYAYTCADGSAQAAFNWGYDYTY
jgi:hypothetical protein